MRIMCAKCERQVGLAEMFVSPCGTKQTITVYCHGERDEMVLHRRDLAEIPPDEWRQIQRGVGVAFRAQALPAKEEVG